MAKSGGSTRVPSAHRGARPTGPSRGRRGPCPPGRGALDGGGTDPGERCSRTLPRAPSGGGGAIAEYFKFAERGTNMATEVKAGADHVHGHGLHHLREPEHPRPAAGLIDPARRGRRDGPDRRRHDDPMGVVGNCPDRPGRRPRASTASSRSSWPSRRRRPRPGAAGAMGVIVLEGIAVLVLVLVGLREAVMHAVPARRSSERSASASACSSCSSASSTAASSPSRRGTGPVPGGVRLPEHAGGLDDPPRPADHGRPVRARKVPAALLLSIVITSVLAFVFGDHVRRRRAASS